MKPTTIADFNIEAHEHYAKNQTSVDPTFTKGAQEIASHFNRVEGTSAIYASQLDELFDLGGTTLWAMISPPENFSKQTAQHFRHRILPTVDDFDPDFQEEEKGKEGEAEGHQAKAKLISKLMQVDNTPGAATARLEQDRSTLVSLFETVAPLNKILAHIYARRMQYQKG